MTDFRKISLAFAGGGLLAGLLAYTELVLDWRTPSTEQKIDFAISSNPSFLMADYNQLRADMTRKYGERVSVSVPVTGYSADRTGVAEVSLEGNYSRLTHSRD